MPDRIRKAAMYWPTRLSMTFQPASTTRTVVNVFIRISDNEMPSIPR